jgi:hypothetical protein
MCQWEAQVSPSYEINGHSPTLVLVQRGLPHPPFDLLSGIVLQ